MSRCHVFELADIIGKKWTIVLLEEVSINGYRGFNALLKRMKKISPKILSQRLKQLEDAGIIEKESFVYSNSLPKTRYRLTKKGEELHKIIANLKEWSIKHSNEKLECGKIECVKCDFY